MKSYDTINRLLKNGPGSVARISRAAVLGIALVSGASPAADAPPAPSAETVEAHAHAGTGPVEREDLTGFFLIGILLNVVMALSFGIWAVRQWRQTRK